MRGESWGMQELTVLGLFGRGARLTGYGVCSETHLPTSTVYDILKRFEAQGLVTKAPERVQPHLSQRVPRMIYRATTGTADQLAVFRALLSS
jgi:DNA-binding IclR family transcriptional regulator